MRALLCGLISAGAGLAATVATQAGHLSATAAVHLSTTDQLAATARAAEPGFVLVSPAEHYDGVYYYAQALDPVLTGRAHTLIDQAAYRYGHPLHGWLAAALSFGQAGAVPVALLVLGVAGLFAAGWAASMLARSLGASPWLGLLVAVSPGLLYATTVDTTETVGAALVLSALVAWRHRRWGWSVLLIVLCCLDKEQYVAVPAGLAAYEAAMALRGRRLPLAWPAKLVAIAAGPIVLAGWYLYVHARLGAWPNHYQSGNLTGPFVGWGRTFHQAWVLQHGGDFYGAEIGDVVAAVLVAFAVAYLIALVRAARLTSVLHGPVIAMIAIASCMDWLTLMYPHEIVRNQAVYLLLAALVVATPRRPAEDQSTTISSNVVVV